MSGHLPSRNFTTTRPNILPTGAIGPSRIFPPKFLNNVPSREERTCSIRASGISVMGPEPDMKRTSTNPVERPDDPVTEIVVFLLDCGIALASEVLTLLLQFLI